MPKNENLQALMQRDSAIFVSLMSKLGDKEIFWNCFRRMVEEHILDITKINFFELLLFEFKRLIASNSVKLERNTVFDSNFKMIFGFALSVNENLEVFMREIGFESLAYGGYLGYEIYMYGIELQFQKGNLQNVRKQIEQFIKEMIENPIDVKKKIEAYNLVAKFFMKNHLFAIDHLQEILFDKIYLDSFIKLRTITDKNDKISNLKMLLGVLRPLFSINNFYDGYYVKSLIPKNIYAALFSKTFEFFDFSIANDYLNLHRLLDFKNSGIFLEKAFKYLCSGVLSHKIEVNSFIQWATEFTNSVKHTKIKYFNTLKGLIKKEDLQDNQTATNVLILIFKTIKSSNCYFEADTQPLLSLVQLIKMTIMKKHRISKLLKRIKKFFANHLTYSLLGSDYSYLLKIQDFTLCFWLKYNSSLNFKPFLHFEGNSNFIADLNISQGQVIFMENGKDLKQNQWHFFTLAKFKSALYIFSDGEMLFERTTDSSTELRISFLTAGLKISVPQVFNRALKYEEILAIFYDQSVRKFRKGCIELKEKEINIYNDNFEKTFEFFNYNSINQSEGFLIIPFSEGLIQFNWLEKILTLIEKNKTIIKQIIVFWIDCYNDLAEKLDENYRIYILQKFLLSLSKQNITKQSKTKQKH